MNIVGKTTVKIHGILLCLMSVLIVNTPVSLSHSFKYQNTQKMHVFTNSKS